MRSFLYNFNLMSVDNDPRPEISPVRLLEFTSSSVKLVNSDKSGKLPDK